MARCDFCFGPSTTRFCSEDCERRFRCDPIREIPTPNDEVVIFDDPAQMDLFK